MEALRTILPFAHMAYEPEGSFENYNSINLLSWVGRGNRMWKENKSIKECLLAQLAISQLMIERDLKAIKNARAAGKRIIIAERSPGSGRHVFAPICCGPLMLNSKDVDGEDALYYDKFMKKMLKMCSNHSVVMENEISSAVLYIDVPAYVCEKRLIAKYKQTATRPATIWYLEEIQRQYRMWSASDFINIPSHLGLSAQRPHVWTKISGFGNRKKMISDVAIIVQRLITVFLQEFSSTLRI